MRIEYTLPSLIPTPAPETTPPAEQFPGKFANTIRRIKTPPHSNWRRLLRLDRAEPSAMVFAPPQQPPGLQMRDSTAERLQWRSMLEDGVRCLSEPMQNPTASDRNKAERIGRMLHLLIEYQQQESSITARAQNETRG